SATASSRRPSPTGRAISSWLARGIRRRCCWRRAGRSRRPRRSSRTSRGSDRAPASAGELTKEGIMAPETHARPQVAIMNAVHDLPVLVARDKGFFRDEGLDLEFVTTPGMAQVTTTHTVKFDSVFERPLDSVYNEGGIDCYRMCEWGIMKR